MDRLWGGRKIKEENNNNNNRWFLAKDLDYSPKTIKNLLLKIYKANKAH